jgi:hypothetical protein
MNNILFIEMKKNSKLIDCSTDMCQSCQGATVGGFTTHCATFVLEKCK